MKIRNIPAIILLLIICSLNYSYSQLKISPTIEVVKLTVEKESDFSIISNFELVFKISNLKNKFINVNEIETTRLTDEFGNDLVSKGKKNYDDKASNGFYTSRQGGWTFQRYSEDSLKNAFKGIFNSFALPAKGSKYVDLSGVFQVVIQKPGKIREEIVKGVEIKPDSSISVDGKSITFKQYGSNSVDNKTFFIYKLETDLAIVEISVVGVIFPEGISQNDDEILVPDDNSKKDILIKTTETETIEIPIKMKIFIGI